MDLAKMATTAALPSPTTTPVPLAAINSDTYLFTLRRPGFLRLDQRAWAGASFGDPRGYSSLGDAIHAARLLQATTTRPAGIAVLDIGAGRYALRVTDRHEYNVNNRPRLYDSLPMMVKPLAGPDVFDKVHPSLAAIVQGSTVIERLRLLERGVPAAR